MHDNARYEQLREAMSNRQFTASRHGLAVLLQEGLAAWLEQWSKLPLATPLPSAGTARAVALPEMACADVVQVLSAMALDHLREVSA